MPTCSEGYFLNLYAIHEGTQRGFLLPLFVAAANALWCSGFLRADPGLWSQGCLVAGLRRKQCRSVSVFPTGDTKVITCHNATDATALLVPSVDLSLDSLEENA